MPVSHIGLTVSHLPTSTSFFASALQPLGYRYIGQSGNQIGFGIHDADFFLCQETPGMRAGAAHIAFTARSANAVRSFYAAALTAGARPNGAPACRTEEDGHFNAAVLDFDGNSIEVVYKNGPDLRIDGTVIEHSRVITWQRTVAESYRDDRSVVSSRTAVSKRAPTEIMSVAPSVVSKAPSTVSKASIARSVSAPVSVPQTTPASNSGDGAAKTIIGTLLGAAAGAAVAYAVVKSEKDSAKKEVDFNAFIDAKNTVQAAVTFLTQVSSQPAQAAQPAQPTEAPQPIPEMVTPPKPESVYAPRQIEAAPVSYYSPSHVSRAPTQVAQQPLALEYAPAYSVAPSQASQARSRYTVQRAVTSPEFLMIENARSVASTSKPRSVAPSAAPSSFISSFVPDVTRRDSEGSVVSHQSSRSKAKSSHTSASRRTSHSKHSRRHEEEEDGESSSAPSEHASRAPSKGASKAPSKAPSMAPSKAPTKAPSVAPSAAPSKPPSKAASIVSSILGRDAKSTVSKAKTAYTVDDWEIDELSDEDDFETVVPSDSISQIGSRRHRKHRSKKHGDDESVVSKHSSTSKHSKHSSRSHRSHKSRSHDSDASADESERRKRSSRPSVVSENSDASTVKPIRGSRKDSVTHGQYDGLFDEVQYGSGSVAARGITPSMISAAGKNPHRGVVNYTHAQRVRVFDP